MIYTYCVYANILNIYVHTHTCDLLEWLKNCGLSTPAMAIFSWKGQGSGELFSPQGGCVSSPNLLLASQGSP